ncbi:DNA polymerase III subunit delta [Acidaminobacterium chupaoyuni]
MAKKTEAYDKLRADVAAGTPEKLYVFYGEESYLKEHYKQRLMQQMSEGGLGDFNVTVLDGDAVTADALTDAVESLPAMSDRKLLLIRDFNFSKPPADTKELLTQFLVELPEYLCLIFYFDTLEYKPDKRMKLWQVLEKNAQVVEFKRAPQSELNAWIKRRFQALGKNIDTADCEYLTFQCGGLMTNLASEIDKIASGTLADAVSAKEIDLLASKALEAQIWQLTDKVSGGDHRAAIETLRDLLAMRFEPVVLSGAIAKQIEKLYGAKLAMNMGYGEGELMKLFAIRSQYPASLLLKAARKKSLPWLRRALLLCNQADQELKSNLSDANRTLELLLLRLARLEEGAR